MLFPRAHAWTPLQRWLIVTGVALAIIASGSFIYRYERYHRGPTDSVFFGTWQIEDGCMDCTNFITLQPNHNVVGFGDGLGSTFLDYHGRWYAGGQALVVHCETDEQSYSIAVRILDIAPDAIHVLWDGRDIRLTRSTREPPQASNQAMQPTAGSIGKEEVRIMKDETAVTRSPTSRRSSCSR